MSLPERTCVVCRKKSPKGSLVRFVVDANQRVIQDDSHLLPGRGAYSHQRCMGKQMEMKLKYSLSRASAKQKQR